MPARKISPHAQSANPPVATALKRTLRLTATAKREQTQTSFTLKGSGFTPSKPVRLSLMFEPGRTVKSYEIRKVTASSSGSFETHYDAHYLSGVDPQTLKPAFVALDVTTGKSAVAETGSAYWYA